jgi:F0F1-type ATP synthase membrane subunit c/vacuolar-type H+-ATPase subunit K
MGRGTGIARVGCGCGSVGCWGWGTQAVARNRLAINALRNFIHPLH